VPATVTVNMTNPATYYVKAWAMYDKGGKNYYDASPVVTVKMHGNLPVVIAGVAFDVTANSASVNAKLFYEGNGTVTSKGFQLSNDGGSTWGDQCPSSSVGDVFSYTFEGLAANTTYKVRAYATNSNGYTGYSEEIQFTTPNGSKSKSSAGNPPSSVYPEVEQNPFFRELTPLQQAILASTSVGDSLGQTATRGDNREDDEDQPVNIPQVNNNTATYGGGICIDLEGANLIFAGSREANPAKLGQINYNYASEAGGGIYIGKESADEYAKMQMMGKCEVNQNHVPASKHGGGIYLDGRLYVGDKDTDPIGTHGLKVDNNWAVDGAHPGLPTEYANNGKLNNVFLTRYEYEFNANATEAGDNKVSVITLLSDISGYADAPTNTNPHSHIGFSVLKGFCPVIATSDCFTKIVGEEEVDGNYNLHNYTPTGETESVSSETWLRNLMIMAGVTGGAGTADALTGAVFEDSESYVAVHTQIDMAPFRNKFIYLWGCWTHPVVKYDPETYNPMAGEGSGGAWLGHYKIKNPSQNTTDGTGNPLEWEIYSPEGLAWFSAYVNGLNAFDEVTGATDSDHDHHAWHKDKNPYAIAHIMNDLDMSAYLWVPIGSVKYFYINNVGGNEQGGSLFVDAEKELTIGTHTYDNENHKFKGVFDGHGHIITGLQGLYLTGIKKYGLFGYLDENAVVKNTFVDDGLFVTDDKNVVYSGGGIAGKMDGGVLSNSEARMDFNVEYSAAGTAVGGLVGEVTGGSIHSTMAMPFITGHDKGEGGSTPTYNAFDGYMGGLVGKLGVGCDLKNSFSNAEIVLTPGGNGPTATRHIGGLVGENNGTVENCYSRYLGTTTPTGFGWFAGTNNTNNIKYCYAAEGKSTAPTEPGINNGGDYKHAGYDPSNHGTYSKTERYSGKYGFKHRDHKITAADNNTTLLVTDIDATGFTNQSFGGPSGNGSSSNSTGQSQTLSTPSGGLMTILNAWVDANNPQQGTPVYTSWTRTMASPINDDYPVLQISDFNSVGSKDGIYMLYEDDINDMWNPNEVLAADPNEVSAADIITKPGKDFKSLNPADYPNAAMYLYDVQPLNGDNKPADVTITDNAKAPLYIHEDVGITQPALVGEEASAAPPQLTARAGVTIRNARANESDPNWHLFSSAIADVSMGLDYHTADESVLNGSSPYKDVIPNKEYHRHEVWENRNYWDPPKTTWVTSNNVLFNYSSATGSNDVGYFPTNTPYGTWRSTGWDAGTNADPKGFFDLYSYDEYFYHWINFKREGSDAYKDHWHWDKNHGDNHHYRLDYGYHKPNQAGDGVDFVPGNEPVFLNGKGYLMALSSESMMMADGVLNTGELKTAVTKSSIDKNLPPNGHGSYNYSVEWRSLNLIGNPYQSYLDFDLFAAANSTIGDTYATIEDNGDVGSKKPYIYYTAFQSDNPPYTPGRLIHPHQGFFVKVGGGGLLTFTNAMRMAGNTGTLPTDAPFRGQVNYPLVNLLCYDEDGIRDLTTVEVNRPEFGGGHKMENLHESKGLIYAHLENESFQTLFTPKGVNVVPVRFVVKEDGNFTLNWNTYHGEFSYLHLIDNITGVDVDCLTNDEYKFEGKTSDYKSRFKLVFRCEGDEPEDPEEPDEPDDGEDSDHFAFMFGDELVVNGEGMLQMFDVQGRCLMETRAVGQQSSHTLPSVAAGVYVFRLTGDKKVKVQKMVIK